jgi:aspartyl-tRNA(Asn)/glutamyl-tRNA(Gln) amidotransferase subunit A
MAQALKGGPAQTGVKHAEFPKGENDGELWSHHAYSTTPVGWRGGHNCSSGRQENRKSAAKGSCGATNSSARDRLEEAIARIADLKGEGARACLTVYSQAARAAADAADGRARAGIVLGPLDGAVVTIKDLFDVAGEPTRAGSKVLADAPPAASDAPVVRRLRAAGSVIVAKTNMTEFAFSVIGINSHYGTPGNPADRTLVPGGSSAGSAVAVADGMCEIAIGSDTGGSLRVPAAFCGIVGFKPTKVRVPAEGAFPLSYTLDSIGPMAKSVAQCGAADAVMSGIDPWTIEPHRLRGLRIGMPQNRLIANLDATEAIKELGRASVELTDIRNLLWLT